MATQNNAIKCKTYSYSYMACPGRHNGLRLHHKPKKMPATSQRSPQGHQEFSQLPWYPIMSFTGPAISQL